MLDDLLVVGFDLQMQREVHMGEKPVEQWRELGYGRMETVVCFYCWRGIDAPAGTKVPLLARGRIGGLVRPHFAHPAGTAPPGGYNPETVWHINAKHRLARWAARSLTSRGFGWSSGPTGSTAAPTSTSPSATAPTWLWRPSAS
ncbi:hypothetical protein GCM10010293_53120 [Streptomyces griseoflavus]|uniref:hypothetical protein n=1 Tax=Streptomyces griseoflavus TaxID=35619 RepID=UPI00167EB75A|nr:hypothetical protein [Streptomyces griseoflavus]GGV45251.1 hypothetical protein GCM10010293_53120 [Streptomyces griseoflavus]